jgi:hypothetical protein
MKNEFNRAGPVLHLLLRYTQALITQMAQTAACNRHHTLDQQLCSQKNWRHRASMAPGRQSTLNLASINGISQYHRHH